MARDLEWGQQYHTKYLKKMQFEAKYSSKSLHYFCTILILIGVKSYGFILKY